MTSGNLRARLDDILDAIAETQALLHGISFEQFKTTWHLKRATERGLEIISEASRSIPEDLSRQSRNQ